MLRGRFSIVRAVLLVLLLGGAAVPAAADTIQPLGDAVFLGSAFTGTGYDAEFEADGNLIVCGRTGDASIDVYLARYAPDLTLVSSTTFDGSGSGSDEALALSLYGGDIYLAGVSDAGTNSADLWVARFDSSLVLLASATLTSPGSNVDLASAITIGPGGEIFTAGKFRNGTFYDDILVVRHASDLSVSSAVVLDSYGGNDIAEDIVYSGGRLYLAGKTRDAVGAENLWLGEFDTDLNRLSSTTFSGGSGFSTDWGKAVTPGPDGTIYLAGAVETPGSQTDIWVGKYGAGLVLLSSGTYDGSSDSPDLDRAEAVSTDRFGNPIVAGRIYETGENGNIGIVKFSRDLAVRGAYDLDRLNANQTDEGLGVLVSTSNLLYAVGLGGGTAGWLGRFELVDIPPETPRLLELARTSMTVSFYPVDAQGYSIEASTASDFSGTVFSSASASLSLSTLTVTGLSANTTYYVRAGALWGSATAYAVFLTSPSLASLPGTIGTTFTSMSSVTAAVQWGIGSNPQGMTEYSAVMTTGTSYPNSCSGNVRVTGHPPGIFPSAVLSGLAPNTSYQLFIEAINHAGVSSGFTAYDSSYTRVAPVWPPGGAPIQDVASDGFGISWDPNGNPLGITTYTLVVSTDFASYGFEPDNVVLSTVPGAGPFATLSGLLPNTTYYTAVYPVSRDGSKSAPATSLSWSTITLTVPPSAAAVPFVDVFESSMSLAWSRNGNPVDVTSYTVVLTTGASYPNAFSGNVSLTTAPAGSSPQSTLEGLAPNTTYQLFVDALNAVGVGSGFTAMAATSTLAEALSSAGAVYAEVRISSFSLSFPGGGDPLGDTLFEMEASTDPAFGEGVSDRALLSTVPAGGFQGTFTGLHPNTTYYVRAAAVNHNGVRSAFSEFGATVTLTVSPQIPAEPFTGVFLTSVSFRWAGVPASPSSASASGYRLEASSTGFGAGWDDVVAANWHFTGYGGGVYSSGTADVGVTTLTVSGLDPQKRYFFRVGFLNWAGVPNFTTFGSTITRAFTRQGLPGAGGNARDAAWGDFDNDGDLDLAVANDGMQDEYVWRNEGGGSFTRIIIAGSARDTRAVAWGDYDNDGDLDLAAANASGEGEVLLRNDGGGAFSVVALPFTGGDSTGLAWGDADNDGDLDLAVVSPSESDILFINGSDGTFTASNLGGPGGRACAWADFDRDGDLDLAVAADSNSDEYLYVNDGGVFNLTTLTGSGGTSYGVAWGDADNDGDLDLAVANEVQGGVGGSDDEGEDEVLLRNDGSGGFTAVQMTGTSGRSRTAAWGDVDDDGRADLLIANAGTGTGQNERLALGRGDGTFTPQRLAGTLEITEAAAWGDFDGDGDLDWAAANDGYLNEYLARNDSGTVVNQAPGRPVLSASDLRLDFSGAVSTLTVRWDGGDYDSRGDTDTVHYALAAATLPMTLSADGRRITSPSSFLLSPVFGSPFLGNYPGPAYQRWPGDASPLHGIALLLDREAGALRSDATYYFRLQAIDLGLARSSWSLEISSYVFRDQPPDGRTLSEVFVSSLSAAYSEVGVGRYVLEASTAPDFSGTPVSSATDSRAVSLLALDGLSANTTYHLRLGVLRRETTTYGSVSPASTCTLPAVPAPAGSAFDEVGVSSMTVFWDGGGNPVDHTTYTVLLTTGVSYPNGDSGNVWLSTTPGGTSPAATLTGLVPNTTYFLFVRAVNHAGTGSAWNGMGSTATLAAVPGAAALSFQTLGPDSAGLAWDSSGNPLGATRYELEASTSPAFDPGASDTASLSTVPAAGPFATLSGLGVNTTYHFRIRAVGHGGGETDFTTLGSTSTLVRPLVSAAFISLHLTSASVAWDRSLNPVDRTTYTVSVTTGTSYPNSFTANRSLSTAPAGSAPVATLSGLIPNTTYSLFIQPVNNNGIGAAFSLLNSSPTLAQAPSPGAATFAWVGVSTVTVAWAALPAAPQAATSEGYVLQASSTAFGGAGPGGLVLSSATPDVSVSTLSVPGLAADTTYYFRVGSLNWQQVPDFTWLGSTLTLPAPVTPVLSTASVWTSSITWSWEDVPQELWFEVLPAASTDSLSGMLPPGTQSWTETGLSTNTAYSRRVLAVSPVDRTTSTARMAYSAAAPPAAGETAAVWVSSLSVSWDVNTNPPGTRFAAESSSSPSFGELAAASEATTSYALLSGLTPNATQYIRVRALNGDGTPTAFIDVPSTITLAAVPGPLYRVSRGSTSLVIDWDPEGNPEPGSVYEVWRDTRSDFAAPVRTVVSTSGASAEELEPSTVYYFKVRAVQNAGGYSDFGTAGGYTTLRPSPLVPSAPAGTALSTTSILWTWETRDDADSYRVYAATDTDAYSGTSVGTAFLMTGLSPNTSYGIFITALNEAGESGVSAEAAAYTGAAAPAALSTTAVFGSSLTLSWSLNGNPVETTAVLERSSDGVSFAGVFTGSAAFFSDSELLGCTTYGYRVRNRSGDGAFTGYLGPSVFRTAASTPLPPGGLSAASIDGRRIRLSWSKAPQEGVTAYDLYSNWGDSGGVDYGRLYAAVSSTVTSYTTGVLSPGVSYRFGIRTVHRCGVEEGNTEVTATATALDALSGARASIRAPAGGSRVSGDRVSVLAAPDAGSSAVKRVLFQARPDGGAWAEIVPPDAAEHPNPDAAEPFFIHWDASALPDGDYELRAVAYDASGSPDASPSAVSVRVSAADPDIQETGLGGGRIRLRQKLHDETGGTVRATAGGGGQVTELRIPAGALSTSTVAVTVTNSPASAPPAPSGTESIGVSAEVSLENAQTVLEGGNEAVVILSFPDADGDGFVDGTAVRAIDLRAYSAPDASGPWTLVPGSSVDLSAKSVSGRTRHFSLFGLFALSYTGMGEVRVYPNPFKPNSGRTDDGSAYSAGDPLSGVVFDRLPASAIVRIYTFTGRLAAELGPADGSGRLRWNGRSAAGTAAASGLYFAVISGPGGARAVRKLAVIR